MAAASSAWRERFRISWTLSIAFSVYALVWLNGVTAGTGRDCGWGLFRIWTEQIDYIRESSTPMYDVWYLITGGSSRMLWLYTWMHVVVAAILGWALAGMAGAIWMLVGRCRGTQEHAAGNGCGTEGK